jgi:hypothetical protein
LRGAERLAIQRSASKAFSCQLGREIWYTTEAPSGEISGFEGKLRASD